jgi:riboflavin kinase / FMN adenylyltransferase
VFHPWLRKLAGCNDFSVCLVHDMKLFRDLADLPAELRGGAVTIGNFDGVHLGHARIVERLRIAADRVGGPAIVFTFDPHPVRLLRPAEAPPPLTWTDRKAELLGLMNVDAMIAYPTDEALLKLTPAEFFDHIIRDRLSARAIVEGPNFRFGRARAGTIEVLRQLAESAGITLDVVEPLLIGGEAVSSSRVRHLIAAGKIDEASHLLMRPYRIRGLVVHGVGRGNKIGCPTANVDAIDTLLPSQGVYAGSTQIDGNLRAAAINIGPNPTFGEHALKVEVHVVDWHGSLYGTVLEVDFLARLRDIQRFDGVEQLQRQLKADIEEARQVLRNRNVNDQ